MTEQIKTIISRLRYIEEACENPREIKGGTYIWINEIAHVQAEINTLYKENRNLDFTLVYKKLEETVNEFFQKAIPVLETRRLVSELKSERFLNKNI